MARRRSGKRAGEAGVPPNGATVGHEAELWAMADALRGSMDAAEYKHVVLGLIFLKYISDAFEERHAAVLAEFGEDAAEDRDEYTAENIFWVPPEVRWTHLKAQARQSTIGLTVDQAMAAIERDNPQADFILANPPFNVSDWGGERLADDNTEGARLDAAIAENLKMLGSEATSDREGRCATPTAPRPFPKCTHRAMIGT